MQDPTVLGLVRTAEESWRATNHSGWHILSQPLVSQQPHTAGTHLMHHAVPHTPHWGFGCTACNQLKACNPCIEYLIDVLPTSLHHSLPLPNWHTPHSCS